MFSYLIDVSHNVLLLSFVYFFFNNMSFFILFQHINNMSRLFLKLVMKIYAITTLNVLIHLASSRRLTILFQILAMLC